MGQARTHILPQERLSCEKERRFHKEIVPHPVGPNWDPTGLVAPVTIKYRIDLQELWSTGYGWDDILPEAIQQEWKENEEAINQLLSFKFDRKLEPDHAIGPPQVQGFAYGGELGYGASIFLRWKLQDGSQQCVPVIVKPFVAPLKRKTIPRLELLGCLLLTRIYNTFQETLAFVNFHECDRTFWTDSRFHLRLDSICQAFKVDSQVSNAMYVFIFS